uniref:SFRICE_024321 n=1 Tax=Spodoptera frugiperda TaxID=7108 RepID=A0A2H1V884_SPOFR
MCRNKNWWITQGLVPSGNRTRYTLQGSQLPSYRASQELKIYTFPKMSENVETKPDKQKNIDH